jgi:hypothetical protein
MLMQVGLLLQLGTLVSTAYSPVRVHTQRKCSMHQEHESEHNDARDNVCILLDVQHSKVSE